ncbi:MAG: type I DNA topoisomerase [Chloroflexi bacterium]|nr:type I DNA topoisomerase [Chloroflexota bacterium]
MPCWCARVSVRRKCGGRWRNCNSARRIIICSIGVRVEAYCFKCKAKREIQNPVAGFNANGGPVTTGVCGVCGTKMYRMGNTDAHAGLEKPVVERSERKAATASRNGSKPARAAKRSGKLVIVESPAKAKTVQRFLGKGFQVRASVGHIRDLLRSQLSVDVENDFAPKYRVPNEKRPVVKEIKSQAATAQEVYLATDPDREGEAISWHLLEAAEIDPQIVKRVVFHEITQPAIAEAFAHPRQIDMRLVNAQQARRILDRLVGYSLSPLLWAKVRGRLSAGRVQSVAVRLIVDREREIEAFVPQEYWSVEAELLKAGEKSNKHSFFARLLRMNDKEVGLDKDLPLPTEESVQPILADLESAVWQVIKVKRGERRRGPSAPFTTSTLQQEASKKLGYTASRTMAIAQQLYEGIDLGEEGVVGLITYMRTDSTNVSETAQAEAREYITGKYGAEYLPPEPPQYKTRAKGAQEAHEAIRPTSVQREPKAISTLLTKDQLKLYQLIWQRFVASQMAAAFFDTVSVDIEAKHAQTYLFRAAGSVIKFLGFMAVYEEAKDEDAVVVDPAEGEGKRLPELADGDPLLVDHFPEIVDLGFTARMEEELDEIADGEREWVPVLREFYEPFAAQVKAAEADMPQVNTGPELVGRDCPVCGKPLVIRYGRYGKFIGCSGFPECRHLEPWLEKVGVICPKDGGDLIERKTRKGRVFYGCANYPNCDWTSWKRPLKQPCPHCNGLLVIANKTSAVCTVCEKLTALDALVAEPAV